MINIIYNKYYYTYIIKYIIIRYICIINNKYKYTENKE